MSDPAMIKCIMKAVTIPVMAKVRIGHFVEAQILESLEVDYIDESEVLTPDAPLQEARSREYWEQRSAAWRSAPGKPSCLEREPESLI